MLRVWWAESPLKSKIESKIYFPLKAAPGREEEMMNVVEIILTAQVEIDLVFTY